MNISFTGIKNMGYQLIQYREAYYEDGTTEYLNPGEDIDKDDYDSDVEEHYLTVQLTDDYNGKDLTEFKNKLKTADIEGNPLHPVNSSLLNITVCKENLTDDFTKPMISLYLNDATEPLEINDKNLSILSFVAKLLKRVSVSKDKDFVVNKDYLESDAATSIIIGEDLREDFGKYYDQMIDQAHSPEVVRNGAGEMSDILQQRMIDYFS